MKIICDVAQKDGKHEAKHRQLKGMGYELVTLPLPVADYIIATPKVLDAIKRKEERGIPIKKLDLLGTYNIAVDTKYGIQEAISNIVHQHERFRDELILARNCNIKLYVLIEDDGEVINEEKDIKNEPCRCINDVFSWKNPRLFIMRGKKQMFPRATKGQTLAKMMITMEKEYGCKFVFCSKNETGKKIVELLHGK